MSRTLVRNTLIVTALFVALLAAQLSTYANTSGTWSQTINAGSQSVDIVDSNGDTVASPTVAFGAFTYDFDDHDATGTFGASEQRVRVYNPTTTETWTINLAASNTTDVWTDGGSNTYDYNDDQGTTDGTDSDSVGGQMTVDPSGGSVAGVDGCSTSNVSAGSSDLFEEGATDSIDIMAASAGAATFCRWDYTGASLSQAIPGGQAAASYDITMVVSIQ